MEVVKILNQFGQKFRIESPTTYSEVKTGTFQKLIEGWDGKFNPKSLVVLYSILTNTKFTDISTSKSSKLEIAIYKVVGFIAAEDLNQLKTPETFTYKGRIIKLPKRLERLTVGQNLRVKQVLMKDFRLCISTITAVYLQPLIDESEYNDDRVEELALEIEEYPITLTYPMASFFIEQLVISGTRWQNLTNRSLSMRDKLQSLKRLLKGL